MNLNIRNKLIIFALLAIIVPLGVSALIILFQLTSFTQERSKERIQSDARVAMSIFAKRQENLRASAQSIAQTLAGRGLVGEPAAPAQASAAAPAAQAPQPSRSLQDVLENARKASQVSFVAVLNNQGKVIAQHNGAPKDEGLYFAKNPLFTDVNSAPQEGPRSGPAVEDEKVLQALGLVERASIEGLKDGLFLEAAAPIITTGDQLRGVVLIGQLVNRDESADAQTGQQSIVNEIKETLYPTLREEAAALIVLGDTVVSTNLPRNEAGGSATGAKVKQSQSSVQQPSFTEEDFGGRMYYTSFVPVSQVGKATGSKEIGRIGVAIRESWFTSIIGTVRWTILAVTLVALLLAVGGAVYASQRLTDPIVQLTEAANRISLGELDVPIGVRTDDEIGTLGEALDRMRISLKQAIERLRKR